MRVAVTGIGVVSPVGVGIKHAWKNILAGKSGIVRLPVDEFPEQLPSRVAGRVPLGPKSEGKWNPTDWIDPKALRRLPLFAQYAVGAAAMALEDGNWQPTEEEQLKYTGVAIGSGIGGIDVAYENSVAYHEGGYRKVSPLFVPSLLANMAAGHVSMANETRGGFRGPNHAVSTACTTGAHAIGDAANMIKLGYAKVMLAGATEACVHPLAVSGFARARALASKYNDEPEKASRPFDKDRDGFVIAEGSAILLLEEEQHALERGARIYATVEGYGMSGDAHHITAPSPDGRGAYDCMEMAIRMAGISGKDVGYVNAHATSTVLGDAIESQAIARALTLPPSEVNISSTKGATGHLLGAAGSLEAAFTIKALDSQTLPPSLNIENLTSEFECNYIREATPASLKYGMSNSFGFGGTNASLIFASP